MESCDALYDFWSNGTNLTGRGNTNRQKERFALWERSGGAGLNDYVGMKTRMGNLFS